MSATTERRQSTGLVAETLRRPIEVAVREGVREALKEEAEITRERSGGGSSGEQADTSGSGRGKFGVLAVLAIGAAAFLLWRRRSGGSGGMGSPTESIRSQSKSESSGGSESADEGMESSDIGASEGGVEMTEDSVEAEDAAPEPGNE